jgi:hypothetical protein
MSARFFLGKLQKTMEIFIPSLALLLLAVAIAYFILPKFAPQILLSSSAVVLAVAVYMHWKQFGVSEYERATWIYKVKDYGAYIILGLVILGAYGFYAMNNWDSRPAIPAMPAITTPTIGGGMDQIAKTVSSRIGQLVKKGRIALD